jgi:hypothetical protein
MRRDKISIAPWAAVGAPRVGYDKEADDWAIKNWRRKPGMSDAALIKYLRGHYAIEMLVGKCDGIPVYSHAEFGIVDETSFRGSFLEKCRNVLSKDVLLQAWMTVVQAWTTVMRPEAAVAYGENLLASAEKAAAAKRRKSPVKRSISSKLRSKASGADRLSLDEQIDIVRAAGRWYIFWGKLGHPIWAYC